MARGSIVMSRMRMVHPGFTTDDMISYLSVTARLLLVLIQVHCTDDAGAFEWKPRSIGLRCMPGDGIDVTPMLDEMETLDLVRRYTAWDGREYGAVRHFRRWNRPRRAMRQHPMPGDMIAYTESDDLGMPVVLQSPDGRRMEGRRKPGPKPGSRRGPLGQTSMLLPMAGGRDGAVITGSSSELGANSPELPAADNCTGIAAPLESLTDSGNSPAPNSSSSAINSNCPEIEGNSQIITARDPLKSLNNPVRTLDSVCESDSGSEESLLVGSVNAAGAGADPPPATPHRKEYKYPVSFEGFWLAYPVHQDRHQAEMEYARVIASGIATHADLMLGLFRWKHDPKRPKAAHWWLKDRNWLDGKQTLNPLTLCEGSPMGREVLIARAVVSDTFSQARRVG
jgi:hypothetical protein